MKGTSPLSVMEEQTQGQTYPKMLIDRIARYLVLPKKHIAKPRKIYCALTRLDALVLSN
jgi:hypothetical protein